MALLKLDFGPYRCQLHNSTIAPDVERRWSMSRHCHAEYELHFILRGNCIVDVETETFVFREGEALLIAPGQYHCPKNASADIVHVAVGFFMPENAAEREFSRRVTPGWKVSLTAETRMLVERIMAETQEKQPFWQEIVYAQYVQLLAELFRTVVSTETHEKGKVKQGEKGKKEAEEVDPRLFLIDDFFERNLTEHGTEELLAKQMNISRRQLSRVLQMHYGMSFREKMCCSRMDRAGWLLRTTDMPVSAVSEAVGYMSETSFFKAFKMHYQMTPLAYRQGTGRKVKDTFER